MGLIHLVQVHAPLQLTYYNGLLRNIQIKIIAFQVNTIFFLRNVSFVILTRRSFILQAAPA